MYYINCEINDLEAQVDRKEFTGDMGVQCTVLSGVFNVCSTDASVQCEAPPLTTSTPTHYLAESSESELSQIDGKDAHADLSFQLSQESTM